MQAGLQINDLWAGYVSRRRRLSVLEGLTLEAERGQVSVVLGSSGAGKSTLINCVAGLHRFQRGSVVFSVEGGARRIEHGPRKRLSPVDRRCIGISFQQSHLWSHLSVRENLVHPQMWLKKLPRDRAAARADTLLESLDLIEHRDAPVTDLSGGQRQRVAVLRALALEPDVLLLDEITASQDPANVEAIFRLVRSYIEKKQCTVLTISHDINFVRRIADHVYLLKAGRIVVHGTTGELFSSPELREFVYAFEQELEQEEAERNRARAEARRERMQG